MAGEVDADNITPLATTCCRLTALLPFPYLILSTTLENILSFPFYGKGIWNSET